MVRSCTHPPRKVCFFIFHYLCSSPIASWFSGEMTVQIRLLPDFSNFSDFLASLFSIFLQPDPHMSFLFSWWCASTPYNQNAFDVKDKRYNYGVEGGSDAWGPDPRAPSLLFWPVFVDLHRWNSDLEVQCTEPTYYYSFKLQRFITKKKKSRNKGKQMAKDEGHIRLRSLSKCDDIGNL